MNTHTHPEHWAFPVKTVPVYAANRQISPLRAIVRDDDDTSVLGVVGRTFKVVKHDDVVSYTDQAFERLGYSFKRTVITSKGGARLYATYDFPLVIEEVTVGDVVSLRLLLRNAYDRSTRLGFHVGAQRLVCKNGLTSFQNWWSVSSKHTGALDLEGLLASVAGIFTGYRDQVLPFWRELARRKISNDGARQFIVDACGYEDEESGLLPSRGSEPWFPRKYFGSVWRQWSTPAADCPAETARNTWVLMNSFLYTVTHEIEKKSFENALRLRQRTEASFRCFLT